MRTITVAFALVVSIPGLAAAQEWEMYSNTQDGFKTVFPGPPTVTNTTYKTQHGYVVPARVYSVDKGREHYSVTVADYRNLEQMGQEHAETCPKGALVCKGGGDLIGIGYWKHDTRGAPVNAAWRIIQRENVKVTEFLWSQHDLVEGYELQATNLPDQSRIYAFVAMHEMKLFIAEATVPKGAPPATLFQTEMGWVDKDGNGIRYSTIYSNEFNGMAPQLCPPVSRDSAKCGPTYPVPPLQRPGRGAGGGGGGQPPQ